MKKRYVVTLTDEERRSLRALVSSGKGVARKLTHARILLKADARRARLDRGIDNADELTRKIAAWEAERNAAKGRVNWRFTTDEVPIRLKKLYPSFEV